MLEILAQQLTDGNALGPMSRQLGADARRAQSTDGHGGLGGLLDAGRDGTAMDDAARIGMGLLGKLLESRQE